MRWVVVYISLFWSGVLAGQSFIASTHASEVEEGTTFTVKFALDNGRGSDFRPPTFAGFRIISGPNTSSSTSIINGRRSSSYILSYSLLATSVGNFTIDPARIRSSGQLLISNPLKIKVIKEKKSEEGGRKFFVRAELSADTVFVGQQVILTLKLYTKVTVERYDLLFEPEFEDIYTKDLPRFSRQSKIEMIEGEQYTTQALRKISLYPQKSGKYNLDGFLLRIGIPEDGKRRNRGFFFNSRLKTKDVKTNNVIFEVFGLPNPKPVSFSGGVGNYQASIKTDRTRMTTDDALSLIVKIRGDGDERMLSAPDLNLGPDFEMYDANEISSKVTPNEDKNRFTKSFEYLIIPKKVGVQWLKPEFSFFYYDSNAYATAIIDSVRLEVRQGTSESTALEKFKEDQKLELEPIVTVWEETKIIKPFVKSSWYWLFWGGWMVAIVGMFWVKKKREEEEGLDPQTRKFLRAKKMAEARLKVAYSNIEDVESTQFFEELALGIKQYLGDKLHIDPAQFSRNNLKRHLEFLGASEELIQDTESLLSNCDMALFASGMAPDRQDAYDQTLRIVMDLEGLVK